MRVPLSWLRDFAPFEGAPAELASTLDDLGLVVEEIEEIGAGLSDVVVASVESIDAIEGADKIRRVVVDAGRGAVEVVCGASNFEVGDRVALAPVGAVLPGGFEIGRRKMKGVVSHGMLCSGRELGLSEDHEGILRLNDVPGATVGRRLLDALGIEPDVVFDISVEANRPDASSIAGVARDLAARMGLPFLVPPPSVPAAPDGDGRAVGGVRPLVSGPPVEELATVKVEDLELCPRFTARVITGVEVAPSPEWLARRLALAGMRPINNVVDASNYVMLELGQPTHPYDLDRLGGHGLLVRRARPGETLVTLDGIERVLGRPGPGLGDTGQDCLICDADGEPVGIGGVMGGTSSEIGVSTTRVLLETAYFVPMAIARTAKRLGLRTEASARFERGCDPAGIDRAAERFVDLLALTAGDRMAVATGTIDVRGDVPGSWEMEVRPTAVNALLGTSLSVTEMSGLLTPIGFAVEPEGSDEAASMRVTVPSFRPDVRPLPAGETDIAEEVARIHGYSRIARRMPSWPQPGRLTSYQRERRLLKEVLCGSGCSEAWTATFVSESDQTRAGFEPPYVEVTNPLVESERYLRASMAPGLLRAVLYNAERRQGSVRLFEVGSVFRRLADPAAPSGRPPVDEPEHLGAVFALESDDAWSAVAAWRAVAEALGVAEWAMGEGPLESQESRVLHVHRSASLVSMSSGGGSTQESIGPDSAVDGGIEFGVVGELDPSLVDHFGLLGPDGRPRRVGWLDLDLGVLLDRSRVRRRPEQAQPVSRFPSSDIDLAFVVEERVPAGAVARTLRRSGGDLLESVQLFDVYRGASVEEGSRSLAYRLRFCALDRTLTDREVGELRQRCVEAVTERHHARLR